MVRPIKPRKLSFDPNVTYFKPKAVPMAFLDEVVLEPDELEALRLCDCEDLDQINAAKKMGVSQATLQRILASARQKTAEALTKGKAIKITREGK